MKSAPLLFACIFKAATVGLALTIIIIGAQNSDQCGIRKYFVIVTLGIMLAVLIRILIWNLICRTCGWRGSVLDLSDGEQALPNWMAEALMTVVVLALLPSVVLAPCSFRFLDS